MSKPFWQSKSLAQMTQSEWESLCDGCGLCCLHKLQDSDSGEITETGIACELLDCHSCQCKDYPNRHSLVSDCVQLTPENVGELAWLPDSCAYRMVHRGEALPWWHPLVSGSSETVHQAGISTRDNCISENEVGEDYWKVVEQKLGIKILHEET